MKLKLIAIGNPFRRDDGAGIAAARALRASTHFEIVEMDAEPGNLFAAWRGADAVIILDAAAPTGAPGRISRIVIGEKTLPKESPVGSTHAFGLAKSIELAEALGERPRTIVVYAIEGEDFSYGEGLSPDVENSIAPLVDSIAQEIILLTKGEAANA